MIQNLLVLVGIVFYFLEQKNPQDHSRGFFY